jgi:Tryptophan-associated transmembrane protein (Trp_oprn_chp)
VNGSRVKLTLLLAGLVLSGALVLASTQPWFSVTVPDHKALSVGGEIAAPALAVLGLTNLVLVAALSIAGPFFRVVLGLLQATIGATVVLSSVLAIANPGASAVALVTKATGVAGSKSVLALVTSISGSLWPWVALVAGVALILLGIVVVVTAGNWPGSSRKYTSARFAETDGSGDAIGAWDSLSDGGDPTAR